MNRKQAIKIIKAKAKARGLTVTLDTKAGKGSHAKITVGARRTTIAATVPPFTLKAILKQLDLED